VRSAALVLVTTAGLGAASTPAQAGEYTVYQCQDPQGRAVGVALDFVKKIEMPNSIDNCSRPGGGFEMVPLGSISPSSGPAFQGVGFRIEVPGAGKGPLTLRRVTAVVSVSTKEAGANANGSLDVAFGPIYTDRIFFEAGAWPGFTRTFSMSNPAGVSAADFQLICYRDCVFANPAMVLHRAEIVIDDPVQPEAPKVELVGLLDGARQRGTRILRFSASDADSGVKLAEVRGPSGTVLASSVAGAGCTYAQVKACPGSLPQLDLAVDTTKLSDGAQALELWITDAGGNTRKTALPTILVDNAPTPTPTPIDVPNTGGSTGSTGSTGPKVQAPKVSLKIVTAKPRAGRPMVFTGTVSPAPATTQRVVLEAKKGKGWIPAGIVKTRAQGKFRWTHTFRNRRTFTMRARVLTSADSSQRAGISGSRTFKVR
jgi:hypothetical protein